jgi:hypothetical protein
MVVAKEFSSKQSGSNHYKAPDAICYGAKADLVITMSFGLNFLKVLLSVRNGGHGVIEYL